ncbi:YIP1 family protein [Parashewanella spongiae]|uniref:YIP1 family protein n=1 Tax=Parashewanella spongiae TaxID=342950 RepID=A0A3A6TQ69_9GAMM|nr:YIP1 family protein [Parashewanella spongiae]MCL1078219.1 YIP1 family protein [Parashewanella spongiae]RJY16287.1 YIP1 family protein [Parashewanella spongiae]
MKSNTVFGAITDIYLSPSKAFNGLKEAKGWSWLAFILVAGFSAAASYLLFSSIDPQYLTDQQLATLDADISAKDYETAKQGILMMQDSMVWTTVIGIIVGLPIINAIYALYFMLVSKIDPTSDAKYGDWYGFSIWTMMPAVINSIGVIVLIVTANTDQLSIYLPNYASLNQLLLGLDPTSSLFTLTESIGIFSIWTIALTIIGLKCWTNFSTNKAVLYSLLPFALVYGVWLIIALV